MSTETDMATLRSRLKVSKTIIWDFDGVIADTEPLQEEAFTRTLIDREIVAEQDFFKRFVGSPETEIWGSLARRQIVSEEEVPELMARRSKIYLELASNIEPAWYVKPILNEADLESVDNIIVSSGRKRHVSTLLSHWGLTERFAAIYCNGLPKTPALTDKYERLEFVKLHHDGPFVIIEDNIDYLSWASDAGMYTVAITHELNSLTDPSKWEIRLPISLSHSS